MPPDPAAPTMIVLRVPPASPHAPVPTTAVHLARALVASALWADVQPAAVGVRRAATEHIGFVGRFDEVALHRFAALRWQLEQQWPHVRYLGYGDAERATERLAQALIEHFGRAALRDFRFVGVPRGGLIVLGMLAYALDLAPEQLTDVGPDDAVRVVVDDCAISGDRFRRYLDAHPHWRRLVFAPLVSAAELRAALVAGEPERVLACLSADDLVDRAPERLGGDHDAWLARWRERTAGRRPWIGQPDPVAFAWNEPDLGFWNPATERREKSWSLVAPEHCLKHRLRNPAAAAPQVMPEDAGALRAGDGVLAIEFEERLHVGAAGWPAPLVLEGVAADLWRALARTGDVDAAAVAVAAEYDADATTVRADLEPFVGQLLAHGALVPRR
jgi:hypothetical protein